MVQSNHGTQDKPAITTHTQERATVMAACNICSAYYISPSPINAFSNQHLPVSCVRGSQQSLRCVTKGRLPHHCCNMSRKHNWVIQNRACGKKHVSPPLLRGNQMPCSFTATDIRCALYTRTHTHTHTNFNFTINSFPSLSLICLFLHSFTSKYI